MFEGEDVLPIAAEHIGEKYVFGAHAPLLQENYKGPWDCAEFASWCAFQAYQIVFGAQEKNPHRADPYSGAWHQDGVRQDTLIDVGAALRTPGAFLVRRPGDTRRIGHVAICTGDGGVYEAHSKNTGVRLDPNAKERYWTTGVLIPGVLYDRGQGDYAPPERVLRIANPFMRGLDVERVQLALKERGFDPGPVDRVYGRMTSAAAHNFQLDAGLNPDGEIGPWTAEALGLSWPITAAETAEIRVPELAPLIGARGTDVSPDSKTYFADAAKSAPKPLAVQVRRVKRLCFARVGSEPEFFVGRIAPYGDYRGLYQNGDKHRAHDLGQLLGGVYDMTQAKDLIGDWSPFIDPTVHAESGGHFCRLNTYDRAQFTFGMYQLAAHTPNDNLILFMRELASLPEFSKYFPDLVIQQGRLHQLSNGGLSTDLEIATNGEARAFMEYLNPTKRDVEDREVEVAARLMRFMHDHIEARDKQVLLAKRLASKKLARAQRKGVPIDGAPLGQVVWVSDALHQGRARYTELAAAMKRRDPIQSLKGVGLSDRYKPRIAAVQSRIDEVEKKLPGFWRRRYGIDLK